jgi:2-methylcitrate synthase
MPPDHGPSDHGPPDHSLPDVTAISSLDEAQGGLSYRGYSIQGWAAHGSYEQVAYLLLHGELPDQRALRAFQDRVAAARELPAALRRAVGSIPAATHPMAALRSAVSLVGNFEPQRTYRRRHSSALAILRAAERLLGAAPALLVHWYQGRLAGARASIPNATDGMAAYLLAAFSGGVRTTRASAPPPAEAVRALDISLMLYAEHVINASTLTARVIASTGADLHAAICGALGALAGPLHGGANESALRLLRRLRSPAHAVAEVDAMLARGARVPGFGHRLYREGDPRSAVHRQLALQLAAHERTPPGARRLVRVAEAVEQFMLTRRGLHANVDWYAAALYQALGIPAVLCTPVFACARLAGWSAHVLEQRARGRLIQPASQHDGPAPRPWPAHE